MLLESIIGTAHSLSEAARQFLEAFVGDYIAAHLLPVFTYPILVSPASSSDLQTQQMIHEY